MDARQPDVRSAAVKGCQKNKAIGSETECETRRAGVITTRRAGR
jgi:hypothetical protein